jgi:hypothetical protein
VFAAGALLARRPAVLASVACHGRDRAPPRPEPRGLRAEPVLASAAQPARRTRSNG